MIQRSILAMSFVAALMMAPVAAMAAETYTIDGVHSSVMFRVKHMDVSYAYGRFDDVKGTFTLSPNPDEMKMDATITTESINTNSAARDKHLKGPDFFNTTQFPKITFKSTSVKRSSPSGPFEVTGDLTMHGVTNPVTIKLTPTGTGKGMRGGYLAGMEGSATVKRTDFGMKGMVGPVADEITVMISLEGNRP